MKFLLILFLSFSAHAQSCDLIEMYQTKLVWDMNNESEIQFYKQVMPIVYIDEKSMRNELRKNKEEVLASGHDLSDFTQYESYEEYLNYSTHKRLELLTYIDEVSGFNQKCKDTDGVLKLKIKISILNNTFDRAEIKFVRKNNKWFFYLVWLKQAQRSPEFDSGVVYFEMPFKKGN